MVSFGVYLPRAIDVNLLIDIAKEIEALGYDSVWLTDHLFDPYGAITSPFPECWTSLTAIGYATKRIRLGSMVLNNSFRNPAVVAKMSSTLDCICAGRFSLGIGAGWFPDEYRRYGLTLPPTHERIKALSEAIQVILGLWTRPEFSFSGQFYSCAAAVNEPKPLQKPHPPLCIGGKSRPILDLVAAYADIFNASGPGKIPTPEEYVNLMDKLRDRCVKGGRDFDAIMKTWGGYICVKDSETEATNAAEQWRLDPTRSVIGNVEACVSRIGEYEDAGVEGFTILFPDLWNSGTLEIASLFAEEVLKKL